MTDPNKIDEIKPEMPVLSLQEQIVGRQITHAPQPVTTPPVNPTFSTGSGGVYIAGSNATNLNTIAETVNEMYLALLKMGLIKKK